MTLFRQFLVTVGILGILGGCAKTKPYQATFAVPNLTKREQQDVSKDGVTVAIAPVTRSNAIKYGLAVELKWREMNRNVFGANSPDSRSESNEQSGSTNTTGGTAARQATMMRSGMLFVGPMPAFAVGIVNQSGRDLSLSGMTIEVVDDHQRPYRPLKDTGELKGRFTTDTQGAFPYVAQNRDQMDRMLSALDNVSLLSPRVSVANGTTWRGYLMLNLDAHDAQEYYAFMKSINGFTVRLKSVPTQAQPADFVFNLDKSEALAMLTCPGDVTDPIPEKCAVDEASPPGSAMPKAEASPSK
jgi:hypothetical protein